MSVPWATETGTGGCIAAKPSGKAFVRSNSAAPTTGPREFPPTPLGKRHTPEVHAAPHVNRKRCHPTAVGSTTDSSAAPVTNASITSAQSTNSQHSPGKKFVRVASAGNMLGGRVTTETPQSDEKGGATPRGRKAVAPSNADGGVGQFVGGAEGHGGISAGRASSADVSASRGRKPAAAPADKGTYDISTIFSTKRRVQPSFADPNELTKARPVFQRNDENTAPLSYRPMINRRPTVPAVSTNGINIPKTNNKAEFTQELNKKVFKPERRIFQRQDNVILGSKSTPVPEGGASSTKAPLDTGLGAGRKRVATPQADESKRELQPAKGLKQVPTPERTTTARGVKPVAGAPKSTVSTLQE